MTVAEVITTLERLRAMHGDDTKCVIEHGCWLEFIGNIEAVMDTRSRKHVIVIGETT